MLKIHFVFFLVISALLTSGCWFEEEEVRPLVNRGLSPQGMFNEAKEQANAGTVDLAIKLYDDVQAAYPASKYAIQSKLETIYLLHKYSRFDEAIDLIDDYINSYSNHVSTPYAYYFRAKIYEDKSKSFLDDFITDNAQRDVSSVVQALQAYLDLIDKYPKSNYAEEAIDKLIVLRNILGRHELFVAIFYTKKQAHISAINRCKYILEKFPSTPSAAAALHLMAYNYDLIGANDLATDTKRVLKSSYPNYVPHYSLED